MTMSDEELHRLLLKRMDSQAEDIKEIRADVKDVKTQTSLTNGRVTSLEKLAERGKGVVAIVVLVLPFVLTKVLG